VPYAAGIGGFVAIAVVARRWTRREDDDPIGGAAAGPGSDDALDARLDDELRYLD
jgi:hypothetical protein